MVCVVNYVVNFCIFIYIYVGRDHDDVHVDARRAGASHEALGNQVVTLVCVVNFVVNIFFIYTCKYLFCIYKFCSK